MTPYALPDELRLQARNATIKKETQRVEGIYLIEKPFVVIQFTDGSQRVNITSSDLRTFWHR
jgi:hypothetical protein